MTVLGDFDDRRFSDLLGMLYDAAAAPDMWPAFLARMGETLGMHAINLSLSTSDMNGGTATLPATWGHDDSTIAEYLGHFAQIDPHRLAAHRMPAGTFGFSERLVADDDFTRTEYFNDFYLRSGMRHGISAVIHNRSGTTSGITLHRGPGQRPPGDDELRFLEVITPHLMRARNLASQLGTLKTQQRATADVLDRLTVGVAFIGRNGLIRHANAMAEAIFVEQDGLRIHEGRLKAQLPAESSALERAVSMASETGLRRNREAASCVRISRPSGQRSLDVMTCSIDVQSEMWSQHDATAFVIISDGRIANDAIEMRMRELYGLSPMESRLVASLASGVTVKQWAEGRGVSVETARWQLKQVFSKTGVSGQSDLIRLVLLGPALAGGDPDRPVAGQLPDFSSSSLEAASGRPG